jgi:tRNA threonylcarbamoyl adenosine modification protein (Sua5/YciO/YrdC/YwlC family)
VAVSANPVDEAIRAVLDGGLVVFPTDTVYGLAARPDDPDATGLVFRAKRRGRELALPVLVPSIASASDVAVFDERAELLAAALWPGALTIVLPRAARSAGWDLGGEAATVGIRQPAHPLAGAILEATGPLAVTSANRSGEPPATTCDGLRRALGDLVEVYLCEDEPAAGSASTVIDLAHGAPRVLRGGAVPIDDVARLLPAGEPLLDSRPSP